MRLKEDACQVPSEKVSLSMSGLRRHLEALRGQPFFVRRGTHQSGIAYDVGDRRRAHHRAADSHGFKRGPAEPFIVARKSRRAAVPYNARSPASSQSRMTSTSEAMPRDTVSRAKIGSSPGLDHDEPDSDLTAESSECPQDTVTILVRRIVADMKDGWWIDIRASRLSRNAQEARRDGQRNHGNASRVDSGERGKIGGGDRAIGNDPIRLPQAVHRPGDDNSGKGAGPPCSQEAPSLEEWDHVVSGDDTGPMQQREEVRVAPVQQMPDIDASGHQAQRPHGSAGMMQGRTDGRRHPFRCDEGKAHSIVLHLAAMMEFP